MPAQQCWGRLFAIASLVTPLLLGVAWVRSPRGGCVAPSGTGFVADYIRPWLSPFTLSVGVLTVLLFAFLAAVYLTVEAEEPELREDFRRRALGAGLAVFLGAMTTLALAWEEAPLVWKGLVTARSALPIHLLTGLARDPRALGALEAPLSNGARRRGRAGDADPVGLGPGAVPLARAPRPQHPRHRRAGGYAQVDVGRPRTRCGRAVPLALLPLSSV